MLDSGHCLKMGVISLIISLNLGISNVTANQETQEDILLQRRREAEAKNMLFSLNLASQAYRLERPTFAKIAQLSITIKGDGYYDFRDAATPTRTGMAYIAKPKPQYANLIKSYAAAVGQTSDGVFTNVVCEAISLKDLAKAAPGTKNSPAQCLKGSRLLKFGVISLAN